MSTALLSYLPSKLSNRPDHELFGNLLYAKYLPQVLNELGYMVDYIDWQDVNFTPLKHYDLFMGHGGYNFARYAPYADRKIYFATGFYWKAFNELEAQRFNNLYERRGVRLQPDRRITTDEESALQMADAIITLGNEVTRASYADFAPVYPIGGMTGQIGQEIGQKDFKAGAKHFLFYSGDGSIHKGLDLLIEAFTDTDLHLHICQRLPLPFLGAYPELDDANIHVHGHIHIHGREFKELVNLCDWVITATCCEGCPSSVLECMAHGLIPVATANASLKMDGAAYITDNIDDINYLCKDLSELDITSIRAMALIARNTARIDYSPENFSLRLKEAVAAICQK